MGVSSVSSPMQYQYQLSQSQRQVLSSSVAISQASNEKVAQVRETLTLYTVQGNERTAEIKGRILDAFT